jgi:hypothetical protein
MMISQQNGTATSPVSAYYCADQWSNFTVAAPGAWSTGQLATPTPSGSPNRIEFYVTTAKAALAASDQASFATGLEGLRMNDLLYGTPQAKTITIRFGCRTNLAGTYCITLENAAANRLYVAEYTIAAGEVGTDVVKSVTIPGDVTGTWVKTSALAMYILWDFAAGSTLQQVAGAWGTTPNTGSPNQVNLFSAVGNYFDLFDVGVYQSTTVPTYVLPDYQQELAECQRYWFASPGFGRFYASAGGQSLTYTFTYPTSMRAAPTLALDGSSRNNISSVSFPAPTITGCGFYVVAAAAGDTYIYNERFTGTARIF